MKSFWILTVALAAGCGAGPAVEWVAAARKAPLAAGHGEELVTATGTAGGSGPEALWQAGLMARRRAVASVLARVVPDDPDNPGAPGTPGDPRTIATRKRILDRWADYVRPGVRVTSKVNADDITTVTLLVVVMSDAMTRDAPRIRRELDPARKPRVIVVMCPVFADGPLPPARAAERAIEEAFASRGFRLVPEVRPAARRAIASALRSDDAQALARAARAVGAEIALVGLAARTREREVEIYGRNVTISTPTVTLRAIHTASGKVIFSREHSGEESVGEAVLANAADEIGEECLDAILRDRSASAPALATAAVSIEGVSFEDFARFVGLARRVPGVALVRAEPFAGETGRVEIDHARDPVDLARALARLEGLRLRLLSAGTGTIRLESTD